MEQAAREQLLEQYAGIAKRGVFNVCLDETDIAILCKAYDVSIGALSTDERYLLHIVLAKLRKRVVPEKRRNM